MITPGWPGLCTAGNVEGGTRGRDGTSYQGHRQAAGGDDGNEDDDDDDDYDDDDDNDNGDHVDVDDDFDMIETEPLTDRLLLVCQCGFHKFIYAFQHVITYFRHFLTKQWRNVLEWSQDRWRNVYFIKFRFLKKTAGTSNFQKKA